MLSPTRNLSKFMRILTQLYELICSGSAKHSSLTYRHSFFFLLFKSIFILFIINKFFHFLKLGDRLLDLLLTLSGLKLGYLLVQLTDSLEVSVS